MKKFLVLTILLSQAVFAKDFNFENKLRGILGWPIIESQQVFEYLSDNNLYEVSHIEFRGQRVFLGSSSTRVPKNLGKCVEIQERLYSDRSYTYKYVGKCQ